MQRARIGGRGPAASAPPAAAVAAVMMAVLLGSVAWPNARVQSRSGEDARAFLARHLGLTQADFRKLDQGGVVAGSLEAADRREVATRGVVHIRIDADTYLDRMSDIVSFKRHEAVMEIGVFSEVPRASDLRGLTLERHDIRDLRSCRVGDCDLKLSADAIERFQREVQWSAPDAERQANDVMRELLARYVADFRARGDAAAMHYVSGRTPVDVAGEFRALLASGGGLLTQFPGLMRHVERYPRGDVEGVRDLFYWSKEKPGPSPIVSITQLVIARGAAGTSETPVRHAVMSRQIYGSRYFDASMGLTLLLPDTAAPTPSTFVVYLNRSRLDVFSGFFGGIIRRTVRSRVRSGMADSLARVKVAMERTGPAPASSR